MGLVSLPSSAKANELFRDLAVALNEANDVTTAMRVILPKLSDALGLTTAWAFRYDRKRQSFVEVGASGLPPALAVCDAQPLHDGWCECQDQFVDGRLNRAVNIVRCSRLRDCKGDKQGLVFHASIPLRTKDRPLGILNLATSGSTGFTEDVLQLLGAVGQQVAIAVDRAALLATERDRAERLRVIADLAGELITIVNPSELLQAACEKFVSALTYSACGIFSFDPDGSQKRTCVASAFHPTEEGRTYHYTNEDAPLVAEADRLLLPTARSQLQVPIPQSNFFLVVESELADAFDHLDHELASLFGWHLTAALENCRLYEQSLTNAKWLERRHLATELHDAVSQRLFSAVLLTRAARLLIDDPAKHHQLATTLANVQNLISEGQSEMRSLIATLQPLEERDWIARLQERVGILQLQGATRFHLTPPIGNLPYVPFEVGQAFLAIADEALQNVLKHAQAKNAYISLSNENSHIRLTIQDDGIGLGSPVVEKGLGLSSMAERASRVHGTFDVHTGQRGGTVVIVSVPCSTFSTDSIEGEEAQS